MDNTSGQGKNATVPAEIDRWNWGAFLLNWIWGIGNNTPIALLMFIPLVNLVMPFVLGVKGSAWAWRNKKWDSVEEFKRVQRKWTLWALVIYAGFVVLCIGIFFAVAASLKESEVYTQAMERLESDSEVIKMLGAPLSTGMVSGSMESSGATGSASLTFPISGPNGEGVVSVDATKESGEWEIDSLKLEEEGTGKRIDLVGDGTGGAPV